ncbi:fork head domain-containing protein [Chlamydoabsidia padenii]|nr:fork head domain-containing protein [Chlamydoabsidia padenii]
MSFAGRNAKIGNSDDSAVLDNDSDRGFTLQQSFHDQISTYDNDNKLVATETKRPLPSIPVAMRHPHVVSSVKQYRIEEQQHQLKQPFVSEAFIPMMPNVTKPPRKRRRPPFSYSSLIAQAILEAENERLTLREIYQWIVLKYPSLYGANDIGWQNTIRHNLSLNRCFKKIPKKDSETSTKGKGGYWTIDPNHMMKFKNGAFARGSSSTLRRKSTNNNNSSSSNTTDRDNTKGTSFIMEQQQQEQELVHSRPSVYLTQEQPLPSPSTSSAPSTRSPSPSFYNTPLVSSKHLQPHNNNKDGHSLLSSTQPTSNTSSTPSTSTCTVMDIHNLLN